MEAIEEAARESKLKAEDMPTYETTNSWRMAEDLVECVVERLSVRDVCALRACSHFFHSVCSSEYIWSLLFKQRWPCLQLEGNPRSSKENKGVECTVIGPCNLHAFSKPPNQGWLETYAALHKEMGRRATSVIDLVRARSLNESVEAYEYQKAMALLSGSGLGFQDVVIYLLTRTQGVLVNLIGIHFSLVQLCIQREEVNAALKRNGVGSRQVCLRWWTMGGWANGFRRRDDMHICTASMDELADPANRHLLNVMERGTVHEVLRVQISADFKSSAWVARDMHSQR